ncbi:histidine phosphatase family protein [Candidatus Kaiserbacteria bacterium]|nr:histidine phosphatase family protein [Candidatus Kaiserbacteria bacterium]MCB9812020.1 histidine phosphatase family protein [Candidatus Nomurabacteria bacterium]
MPEGNVKRVYFVRHGETCANRRHIHQAPEEPLSDLGRAQAKAVAPLLAEEGIDTLACSPFVRARQTAEIIGQELDIPHTIIDGVEEFRRPRSLYGKSHFNFGSFTYLLSLYRHRTEPDWDNEGAENLFQVRNRIKNAQQAIASLHGERVAVVSHAVFIDMFTQMVCADRDLKLREFVSGLLGAKKLPNTGIVAFDVDLMAPDGTCRWWYVDPNTAVE